MIEDHFPAALPLQPVSPPSSFAALLRSQSMAPTWEIPAGSGLAIEPAEATTILAVRYDGGVVMVGDRQATEGYSVAHRRVQKVYPADKFSAVAISGTAGIAIEMIRLFQTELEHYEKLEGSRLSLEGKANHLASMVRSQLPMAFQGLVVVPIFCGYDEREAAGHLYSYDVVGGRYEEHDHTATGSGGREAKSYLRNAFEPGLDRDASVQLALRALVAAAEEDTATAGPDLRRGIYPTVVVVSADEYTEVAEDEVVALSQAALDVAP